MEKKYFKVGMPVWCAIFGEGIVIKIKYSENYAIEVERKNGGLCKYTKDGKYFDDNISNVVLSTTPLAPIINEPIDDRIELPKDVVAHLLFTGYDDEHSASLEELKQKYKI
jgi:hypothetical protein